MTRIITTALILAGTCLAQQPAATGAAAPAGQQGQGGGQGRGGGGQQGAAQGPREYPPNERIGIDVDRYVGNPFASIAKVSHDVILTRSILRTGDPHVPGEPGAVLQYRRDFALGTMLAKNRTPLVTLPYEQIFYMESGQGRLDNGKESWDLRNGVAVLVPPNAAHRLTNLGDTPMTFLMLSWDNPAGVTPRTEILVRDVNLMPFVEKNAHWSYMAKNIFNSSHGLHPNEKVLVVYVAPMSLGGPHAHPPQWEEVWTKIGEGPSYMMMGSEVREMPPYTAMIAPPNGQTVHSVFNLTRDKTQAFFYFGRYTTPAPSNYKDEATVPGQPLK